MGYHPNVRHWSSTTISHWRILQATSPINSTYNYRSCVRARPSCSTTSFSRPTNLTCCQPRWLNWIVWLHCSNKIRIRKLKSVGIPIMWEVPHTTRAFPWEGQMPLKPILLEKGFQKTDWQQRGLDPQNRFLRTAVKPVVLWTGGWCFSHDKGEENHFLIR